MFTFNFGKGKTLHSQAREVIHNVTNYFGRECLENSPIVPIPQVCKRTAVATGVSIGTVKRIRREVDALKASGGKELSSPGKHRKRPAVRNCNLEDFDKCTIRRVIQDYYIEKGVAPSVSKLMVVLKETIDFKWGNETLRKALGKMNFGWRRLGSSAKCKKILLENPEVVAWRCRYLREMRNHRKNGRTTAFLSHKHVDVTPEQDGPGVDAGKDSRKERVTVVYAGLPDRLVSDLVHGTSSSKGKMDLETFEQWVMLRVIPNLPQKCVVCMDCGPYDAKKTRVIPEYSTRDAMTDWLTSRQVRFEPDMRKAELYELIKKNAPKSWTSGIDRMFTDRGHDVLWLPPHHSDLNAMEYIWSSVKPYVTGKSDSPDLQSVVRYAFGQVSADEWRETWEHVRVVEDRYWEKDGLLEEVMDKIGTDGGGGSCGGSDPGSSTDNDDCSSDSDGSLMMICESD